MPKQFDLVGLLTQAENRLAKGDAKAALYSIRECLKFVADEQTRITLELKRKRRRKQLLAETHLGQQVLKEEL